MEERIQTELTEKICRAFAGKEEVNMAEIGLLLQREGIQYKAMGYAKLGDFMRALTAFSLEDRVSAPGNPPYTVVHMPKAAAKEQGARQRPFGRAPEPRQAAMPHLQADRQTADAALRQQRQAERRAEELGRRICTTLGGQRQVPLSEIGLLLQRQGIDYRQRGFAGLGQMIEALPGFTVKQQRPALPGQAPQGTVMLPPLAYDEQAQKQEIRALLFQAFEGRETETLAEVGNCLCKAGVNYRGLGFMKLADLVSWLGGMTLESCVAVPGHAPYYLVHFNQQAGAREAAAKPMTAERNRQEAHDRPQPLQRAALRQEPLARQKRGLFGFAFVPAAKVLPLADLCGTKLSPMEYLVHRFEAVQPVETAEHAWFDTGMLFAETGRPIFAYFERNIHANMQPWFFVDFREDPAQPESRSKTEQRPAFSRENRPVKKTEIRPAAMQTQEKPRPRFVLPGKELEAFAYMGNWTETLQTLADKALPENWDFLTQDEQGGYRLLHSYLCYTFYRLKVQNKIRITQTQDFAAFNTGLVTPSYDEIYACFEPNHGGQSRWQLAGFCRAGERGIGKKLTDKFNPLPQAATYFEDLRDVLYEPQRTPIVDYQHIIIDNVKRLPMAFLRNQCYDSAEAMAMLAKVERAATPAARGRAMQQLGEYIEDTQWLFNRIRNRIKDAIDLAVKRVSWNYKTAIPMFYPRGNAMSLLLPLCLNEENKTDVALVVQRTMSGNYQRQTILTLSQAYLDARLVCRPDSDWLRTDSIDDALEEQEDE